MKIQEKAGGAVGFATKSQLYAFPLFSTRLKAETDQSHYTELQEAQGQLITLLWKITLVFINTM